MPEADLFDLQRFLSAQAAHFESALAELRAGRKRSHWMWFVFPQLRGLGRSATASFYGIGSAEEARAYMAHHVLGPRLVACTEAVLTIEASSLQVIFGSPDDVKFCSSMTLFCSLSAARGDPFRRALDRFCDGRPDPITLALLKRDAE